ncbi:AI-2E family transporter [bacterium]|nr:AI-2E family transporter [bacterium]
MIKNASTYLLYLVLIALAIATIWFFDTIIAYILISVALAFIAQPIKKLFQKVKFGKKHLTDGLVSIFTISTLIIAITIGINILLPIIIEEGKSLTQINTKEVVENFREPLKSIEGYYNSFVSDEVPLDIYIQTKLKSFLNLANTSNIINKIAGLLGNVFIGAFSILFILFFVIKDQELLYEKVISIIPKKNHESVSDIVNNSRTSLTRYFVGICIQSIIIITLISVGLSIIGVKNAFLIGFFAGILNIIPYLGPIIGMAFGVMIGLITHLEADILTEILPLLGKIMGVFLTMQLLDNFILQPIIFSKSVKAHPLEIFLVIMLGGSIAGVIGMVLAIPTFTILRIVVVEILEDNKPLNSNPK